MQVGSNLSVERSGLQTLGFLLLASWLSGGCVSLQTTPVSQIMVQTNKAALPGWMALRGGVLHWQSDEVQFVYHHSRMSELVLGLRQAQIAAKENFARKLAVVFLADAERFSQGMNYSQRMELRSLVFRSVTEAIEVNVSIADIYYRQIRPLLPSSGEVFECNFLVSLKISHWRECKQELVRRLIHHDDLKLRRIGQSM